MLPTHCLWNLVFTLDAFQNPMRVQIRLGKRYSVLQALRNLYVSRGFKPDKSHWWRQEKRPVTIVPAFHKNNPAGQGNHPPHQFGVKSRCWCTSIWDVVMQIFFLPLQIFRIDIWYCLVFRNWINILWVIIFFTFDEKLFIYVIGRSKFILSTWYIWYKYRIFFSFS